MTSKSSRAKNIRTLLGFAFRNELTQEMIIFFILLLFIKAYYAYDNDGANAVREPVYNEELGLAIEKLKDGYQLKNLWDILNG
jgi:hypothetical protein